MATRQRALEIAPEGITIRPARAEDAEECGRICHAAFTQLNVKHGFPPDFPNADVATQLLSMLFKHPGFYCVVAEAGGRLIGSNCLDERTPIAGVGPITVDPETQNKSVGRSLMQAVLKRAEEKKFPGVRLLQAAFHNRSLSLYTKLGFDAREPISVMQGPPINRPMEGYRVRAVARKDLEECNRLCRAVHGHDRGGELLDAIHDGSAVAAERGGRITAYATGLGFFLHAVAETNEDLQALIATAKEFQGPGILVPTRNAELFRWCLQNCLHVVEPMTLMTMGLYNEPRGAYLPSVTF
ncbi:MAG TPA: GNAT family N-acetyltransferase [Candidatus Acidoferrum sp.]|nr:GNAT family N-acetyltransferase [Candidatus Acidoferrum sp.]